MKIDFASCIVTGGNFMRQRVESAMENYSAASVDYFQMIMAKRKEAFCDSACGFLLLDGLLQKNKIDRAELVIMVDERNRPHVSAENLRSGDGKRQRGRHDRLRCSARQGLFPRENAGAFARFYERKGACRVREKRL